MILKDGTGSESSRQVVLIVEMADRTRRAQIAVPRNMKFADLVKLCRKNWSLPFGIDYNIASAKSGRQFLAQESLSSENVANGDVLFLLPFPVHGKR